MSWLRATAAWAAGAIVLALAPACCAPTAAHAQASREALAAKLPASNLSGDQAHQDIARLIATVDEAVRA